MKKLLLIFLLVPILLNAQIRRAFLFEQNGLNIYPTTTLSNLLPYSNQLGNLGSNSVRWNFGYFDTTIANHITSSMFSGSGAGLTSIPISATTGLQDSLNLRQYIYVDKLSSDSLGLTSPFTKFNFGSTSRLYFGNIWQTGTSDNYFAGKVSIGIVNPMEKLHVYGNAIFGSNAGTYMPLIVANEGFSTAAAPDYTWGYDRNTGIFHPAVEAVAITNDGTEAMRITNGNIGIGTPTPYAQYSQVGTTPIMYLTDSDINTNRTSVATATDTSAIMFNASAAQPTLTMRNTTGLGFVLSTLAGGGASFDGAITSGKYISATDSILVGGTKLNVPDYVFDSDYSQRSISDMENFYKINKHLPTMPKGSELTKNPINVMAFGMNLLETIEVQAKYIVELNNRITQLEKKK
ncbi:MAG: hypothetical protein ABIJ40_05375 [Bacteroidota bacterium]